jgi:hypothetical protein
MGPFDGHTAEENTKSQDTSGQIGLLRSPERLPVQPKKAPLLKGLILRLLEGLQGS